MWILWLAIGFVIGWLLFKRPEKVSEWIAWGKSKVGLDL